MIVAVTSEGRRAPEQASHELSLGEVSDVLLNLDRTLARAKKAKKQMAKDPAAHDAVLALDDLICEQERARKRLVHDTYYAGAGAFTDLKALHLALVRAVRPATSGRATVSAPRTGSAIARTDGVRIDSIESFLLPPSRC